MYIHTQMKCKLSKSEGAAISHFINIEQNFTVLLHVFSSAVHMFKMTLI
jgi:hypothetical protein